MGVALVADDVGLAVQDRPDARQRLRHPGHQRRVPHEPLGDARPRQRQQRGAGGLAGGGVGVEQEAAEAVDVDGGDAVRDADQVLGEAAPQHLRRLVADPRVAVAGEAQDHGQAAAVEEALARVGALEQLQDGLPRLELDLERLAALDEAHEHLHRAEARHHLAVRGHAGQRGDGRRLQGRSCGSGHAGPFVRVLAGLGRNGDMLALRWGHLDVTIKGLFMRIRTGKEQGYAHRENRNYRKHLTLRT